MGEEINIYLSWKGLYAPRAYQSYAPYLQKFDFFCKKEIEMIEIMDIIEFQSLMQKKYRPKTIEYALTILRNFFKFWQKKKNLNIDFEEIKIPKAQSSSHQAITFEDFQKMTSWKIKDFWDLQVMLIIRLLYDTGVRVAELCDLNITDMEQGSAVIKSRKINLQRRIFWTNDTQSFLDVFLQKRMELNNSQSLLIGRFLDGTPSKRLTTRSVQRIIKKISNREGVQNKITPHSFRHGKAHRILQQQGTVKDVSAILGHQNPSSSFVYLQWSDMELKERAQKFL